MGNLALQTVAFDRSIGTSIVAVASTFKRHSMFRWKDPEPERFDDKLETGKRVTFWNRSEKVAIAYFGRDVHLPLIALDLGSQLVPQVRTHYPSEDLMQKSRCFGSNLEVQLVCLHFGTQPATIGLRANHEWHGFSPALDDLGSARKMQILHFI